MASMGGPVDINLLAVLGVIDLYSAKYDFDPVAKVDMFEDIHFCYKVYLSEVFPDKFGEVATSADEEDEV